MQRRHFLLGGLAAALPTLLAGPVHAADEGLAVIAHPGLKGLDAETIRRAFTGRAVELDGQALRPVNLPSAHPLRQRFLKALLQQDDEAYLAYWTVRRYIGKGVPPAELRSTAEVLDFVARTPGAIGYVDPAELRAGVAVVLRR
ncbi:hypothetical protein KAK06_18955 [Ideonella sp. 4Y11]|uniref:Phosphate ABC transporter substrate-binding protein n=1 Tax=Ideonella aquatica TaxID=2824119 RepID=A0A940YQE7_9BURK|nr:hypothetical protein [Ideonella aquatica]MBQ0961042.1 hypothetical protein [Ideonella aquatica]